MARFVGEYVIQNYLSQGGFGTVYEVYSKKLQRIVALKMIKVWTLHNSWSSLQTQYIEDANNAQIEAKRLRDCSNDYIIPVYAPQCSQYYPSQYYDDFLHEDINSSYSYLANLNVCIVMKLCTQVLDF